VDRQDNLQQAMLHGGKLVGWALYNKATVAGPLLLTCHDNAAEEAR
jgi:hypothetical protein